MIDIRGKDNAYNVDTSTAKGLSEGVKTLQPTRIITNAIKDNLKTRKETIYNVSSFDVMQFVGLETTSPTVEREDEDGIGSVSDNNPEILGGKEVETTDIEVVGSNETKIEDDKSVSLSRDEIAFFVEVLLEGFDWVFMKGMEMANRKVSKTTDKQKSRIIDAVVRIADKREIKLTPEISLLILFTVTYGLKAIKSDSITKDVTETKVDEPKRRLVVIPKTETKVLTEYKEDRGVI